LQVESTEICDPPNLANRGLGSKHFPPWRRLTSRQGNELQDCKVYGVEKKDVYELEDLDKEDENEWAAG
jgi:hypothetical protein